MKKIVVLLLATLMCLSLFAGCNKKDEKTAATEGSKFAEKTLKAYKKLFGDDAIADGSYIRASYNNDITYFKIEGGKLSEANPDYVLEIRGEHIEITHDDLSEINENTALYLAPGSKLPEGFEKKDALRQAEESLKLYQTPVKEGDPKRVMPDEAIFKIEINNNTYYYMCVGDAVKDESPEYKDLVESDKYVLDEADFFSFTVTLYFCLNDSYYEMQAKSQAGSVIDAYQGPNQNGSDDTQMQSIPDEAIIVVKLNGKTYYFMVENGAIKEQSKDYKKLVKSDDYEKSDMDFGDGITLYVKK